MQRAKIWLALFLWLTLALVSLFVISNPQVKTEHLSEADTYLKKGQSGPFSGSVLVAQDSKILLSRGYGKADIAIGTANTAQTRFPIASITKQFTAIAILQLVQQAKLNLNNPVCRFITNCPVAWEPVTVHHLLSHTSGIPNTEAVAGVALALQKAVSVEQAIDLLADYALESAPGTKFSYSNGGYALLGYLIERISGQPYEAFLQKNIFERLGMKATSFECKTECAITYIDKDGKLIVAEQPDLRLFKAAGGLYSTAEDLYRWAQAFSTEKLISQPLLNQMFTSAITADHDNGYGYGWAVGRQQNRRYFHHEGSLPGALSTLGYFPDQQIVVIILGNTETAPIGSISYNLAAFTFKEQTMADMRIWVQLFVLILAVPALAVGGWLLIIVVRQVRHIAWQRSFWLVGWLPLLGSAGLIIVGLWLDNSPWRWTEFEALWTERIVETFVPLIAGLQAAFILSPEDEPALEVTLACPRPYSWMLLERLALLFLSQSGLALLGSLTTLIIMGSDNVGLAVLRWAAPLLFMVGLACAVTLASRQTLMGLAAILLAWFGMVLVGGQLVTNYPYLWPVHLYWQPLSNGWNDYYLLNRAVLTLLGVALLTRATYQTGNTEHLLLGARSLKKAE